MPRKNEPDLTRALFRVTQGRTGLAVHRDAQGHIIEQREIPYITQQQYTGRDLLASIVSSQLSGSVMFLGYQWPQGGRKSKGFSAPPYPTPPPRGVHGRKLSKKELRECRREMVAELESKKRAANLRLGEYFPIPDFGSSVNREWLHRHLPAELGASEMQELEIVQIPRYYK